MKLSKLEILLAFTFLFIGITLFTTQAKMSTPAPVSFLFQTSAAQVKTGEPVTLSLYLGGKEADKVTALNIKFDYDKTKLKLISAKKGEFFPSSLVLKWDNNEAHYALAQNPTVRPNPNQTTAPVLTLEFSVIANAGATQITSNRESLVYIYKKGGFSPQSQSMVLVIE
jgi:hypothetical protein